MKIVNELKELNLDDNEIKVYLSCLSEGGASVLDISKKSGLIRTTVYGVLDSLKRKGLISSMKRESVNFFIAASPKELLNILDEKKSKISSIVPELEKMRTKFDKKQEVEYFEGKNGVKTITNDIISLPNQTVKILGAGSEWYGFSDYFADNYYLRKKKANVKTKTILADNKEERDFVKSKVAKNSDFRFLKNFDLTKDTVFIYHDKVSFVVYDKEEAHGFIIKDKDFNALQNFLFDNLWDKAKK